MRTWTKLLLALLLCAPAWAANDFSSDGNCKGVFNMDNGALTTDSKGGNTLTNSGVTNDTVNYKQGDASGEFNALADILYRNDGDLDAGFPGKSSGGSQTFSACGWFRVSGFPTNDYRHITGKTSATSGGRSWLVMAYNPDYPTTGYQLCLAIGYNSGNSFENIYHASELSAGVWYHFGVTFNNATKAYRIRIWDDTAGAILGVDKTGTATNNMYLGTGVFHIGRAGSSSDCMGGQKDEIVVFDDVLSTTEIDQIRAGTYGAAATGNPQIF